MIYIDTSVLVSAMSAETMSVDARRWLAAQPIDDLAISWWVDVEVASALATKARAGDLTQAQRQQVESLWQLMRAGFAMIGLERQHFHRAAYLVDKGNGLRAADALHLALAQDRGWQIATFDHGMAAAARQAGIVVVAIAS